MLQSPSVPGTDAGTVTAASVFFGNRPSETTAEPNPVNGAQVNVTDDAGASFSAAAAGDAGFYLASSLTGPARYDANSVYSFTLTDSASTVYTAQGSAPPPETVAQIETTFIDDGGLPLPVCARIQAGTSFVLTRSATPDSSGELDIAFVAVFFAPLGHHPQRQPHLDQRAPTMQPLDFLNPDRERLPSGWHPRPSTCRAAFSDRGSLPHRSLTAVTQGRGHQHRPLQRLGDPARGGHRRNHRRALRIQGIEARGLV